MSLAGHKALNLDKVHGAFSVKVIFFWCEVIKTQMNYKTLGCWSFVISVSGFLKFFPTSPRIPFHRSVARSVSLLYILCGLPGRVFTAKGMEHPTVQMIKPKKLCQDYLFVKMRVCVVRDNAECFIWDLRQKSQYGCI